MIKNISILGAGAFGTSLAISYSQVFDVNLYSCFDDHVSVMQRTRINEFLKNFKIPENVKIDNIQNINQDSTDCIFWCFPVQPSVDILKNIANKINGLPVILCSKGLCSNGELLSNLFQNILDKSQIMCMAGPNFAHEIANLKPSSADLACKTKSEQYSKILSHKYFKLYPTTDIVGIQVYSTIKNIIAIASGIIEKSLSSANASATLISLAVQEMSHLGKLIGAENNTILGLSGIGDLVLTTSHKNSRNFSLGYNIAATKQNISNLISQSEAVCEGYFAAKQIKQLADKYNLFMPICSRVYKILYENADVSLVLDVFK